MISLPPMAMERTDLGEPRASVSAFEVLAQGRNGEPATQALQRFEGNVQEFFEVRRPPVTQRVHAIGVIARFTHCITDGIAHSFLLDPFPK